MFYIINSSSMLVTKSVFKLIFVLSNYQTCTLPLNKKQTKQKPQLNIIFLAPRKEFLTVQKAVNQTLVKKNHGRVSWLNKRSTLFFHCLWSFHTEHS